jgi:hypothetical protein
MAENGQIKSVGQKQVVTVSHNAVEDIQCQVFSAAEGPVDVRAGFEISHGT